MNAGGGLTILRRPETVIPERRTRAEDVMPNNESAKKRLRQADTRRARNRAVKSEIRTRTRQLLTMDSRAEAESALSDLYARLDRAARKGIIPEGNAARQKARIARYVEGLS